MAKKDLETFLQDWKNIMVNNLDAKIDEINAEKADGVNLEKIPEAAYFDSMNEEVINYDPFIHYGISAAETTSLGSASGFGVKIFFEVAYVDQGSGINMMNSINRTKLMRYHRALLEIVNANFEKVRYASTATLDSITPVGIRDAETGQVLYYMSGVEIGANIWL